MGNLRFRQVHLDFHTSEKIPQVGNLFDPEVFVDTLKKANVDSITCFARCHHGMIYYDTKLPARHPGLKRNLLKEQIDACHLAGIKVPIYITVGWDEYMAIRHPEWLERTADGKPYGAGPFEADWKKLCFNNPYIDYIEEQTIEVLEVFNKDVDGLFFDIVWQNPCCCNYCIADMEKDGLNPECEEDRKQFAERVVNGFKRRMTTVIRKYNKSCTIFYNASHIGPSIRKTIDCYTHLELESLPSGGWGYEHFPISVRYARNFGKEYLAATGKFHKSWADFGGFKNKEALEYECFTGLANGAKCSIGDQLHPDGAINKATYELIGGIYNKVKAVEEFCDDVEAVTEIAIFSPEVILGTQRSLNPYIKGAYRMLEESHYQFDIIDDEIDFSKYRVIILPDVIRLNENLKNKLELYLKNGGNVILSYKSGMDTNEEKFILNEMGVEYISNAEYSPDYIKVSDEINNGLLDTEYVMYDRGLWVKPLERARVLADIWNPYFNRTYQNFCSHFQTPVEKKSGYPAITKSGQVIYFSHPIFSMYHKHGMKAYKIIVNNCINILLKNRLIIIDAPTTSNITFNYQSKNNRYIMHILHYIPERRSEEIDTIEDIIPLYNIKLKVKLPKQPQKVYCVRDAKQLSFDYSNGYCEIKVPKINGYEIVIFE